MDEWPTGKDHPDEFYSGDKVHNLADVVREDPPQFKSVIEGSKAAEESDSNLVQFALTELNAAKLMPGNDADDFYGGMTGTAVLDLVKVFAAQGHSGMSAPIVRQIFDRVSMFLPLGPLTGEDAEWNEAGDGMFQNRRCSHVFKQADRFGGEPYNSEAVVFEDQDGQRFTNVDSRRVIQFPYTVPDSPEIVKVHREGDASNG